MRYIRLFIHQTFQPSRRRDCLSCIDPLHPHNPRKRTIIPRPAPPPLSPLSKVRCCRPKEFGRLPEGLSHQPFAPHQPLQNRTIPRSALPHLPPLSKVRCCRPKEFGRLPEGLPQLHRPSSSPQPLQKDNNPSPCTTTLASLVKGRWLDGKAQTVVLLRFNCNTPAFFIHQTFLPSRRRDCLSCIDPLHPHNPRKRTIIPRPAPPPLPPLSKVSFCC